MESKNRKIIAQSEAFKSFTDTEKLNFLVHMDEALEKIRYRHTSVSEGFSAILNKMNSLN